MNKSIVLLVVTLSVLLILCACGKKTTDAVSTGGLSDSASSQPADPPVSNTADTTDEINISMFDPEQPDTVVIVSSDNNTPGNGDATPDSTGNNGNTSPGTGNSQITPATPHSHVRVTDAAVSATCQKTGLTEGSHCSVCGAVLVKQQTVPKADHKYENGLCIWCGEVDPAADPVFMGGTDEFELPLIPG